MLWTVWNYGLTVTWAVTIVIGRTAMERVMTIGKPVWRSNKLNIKPYSYYNGHDNIQATRTVSGQHLHVCGYNDRCKYSVIQRGLAHWLDMGKRIISYHPLDPHTR